MQQKASETELKLKESEGKRVIQNNSETKKTSQMSLLAGAIKRKSSENEKDNNKVLKSKYLYKYFFYFILSTSVFGILAIQK